MARSTERPAGPTHLEIKGWATFQHYKDRRPPWIKLYAALLYDPAFVALPEAAQAQLVKLWLLASQMGHPLPNDPKLIGGKIGAQKRFMLAELVASGFVIPCKHDADKMLADALAKSSPLAGADAQSRQSSEDINNQPPPSAREAFLRTVPNRTAWEQEFAALRNGMHPPVPSDDDIEVACRHFLGNGDRPNVALFRGYLRRLAAGEKPTAIPFRRGGVGQRTAEAAYAAIIQESQK